MQGEEINKFSMMLAETLKYIGNARREGGIIKKHVFNENGSFPPSIFGTDSARTCKETFFSPCINTAFQVSQDHRGPSSVEDREN